MADPGNDTNLTNGEGTHTTDARQEDSSELAKSPAAHLQSLAKQQDTVTSMDEDTARPVETASAEVPKEADAQISKDADARSPRQTEKAESRTEKERDRAREKDKDKEKRREKDRDRDRDRDKDSKHRKEKRRSRSRSRSRDRKERRRSRSRDRSSKRRSRSRSRSRDRRRGYRSRSADRRRGGSRRSLSPPPRSRSSRRSRSPSKSNRDRSRSSSLDYGGYKPRKRQEPASKWAGPSTGSDPFQSLRSKVVPTDPAEAARMWQEQQLRARQLVLQQQAASAAAAASKTQREVYVGNLVPGAVTDVGLRQLFNSALMVQFPQSAVPGMEPVVNVNLHSDGRYAFVELRTPEMATAALSLSGQVQLLGQAISVGRPSGYVDPSKAAAAAAAAAQALAAFQAGQLDAVQAASMAGTTLTLPPAIGAIPQATSLPGFPGMATALPGMATALPGIAGLPGAVGLPAAAAAAYPAAALVAPAAAPVVVAAPAPATSMNMVVDGVSGVPTTCICVTGMVNADVLAEDQEYADVIEDLQEECNRHAPGSVLQVKVPRPPVPQQAAQYVGTGNFGKAFVHFADTASAQKARDAIHGRMFAGSVVQVFFINQDAYNRV